MAEGAAGSPYGIDARIDQPQVDQPQVDQPQVDLRSDVAQPLAPHAAERIIDQALASTENRRAFEQLGRRILDDVRGFSRPCIGLMATDQGGDSTLIAASLSSVLAEMEGDVLVLDADQRQRCLSLLYGIADRPGVNDTVRRLGRLSEHTFCTPRQVRLVGAGTDFRDIEPPTVEEWGLLLSTARCQSARILVDLGADYSSQLARLCDAVYLVISLDRTTRHSFEVLARELPRQGIRLCGAIAAI